MIKLKNKIITIFAFLLAFVMLFTAIPFAGEVHATESAEEQELRDKIAVLQQQQTELQQKLDSAESNADEQAKQKEYLDALMATTLTEIDTAQQLVEQCDAQIKSAEERIAQLQAQIDEEYEATKIYLRSSYMDGAIGYLEMILEAESFTDFLMTLDLISYTLRNSEKQTAEFEALVSELEAQENKLVASKEEQSKLVKEKETSMLLLEEQKAKAQEYMLAYEEAARTYSDEYKAAKAAEAELNERLKELLKAPADPGDPVEPNPPPASDGTFIWPVSPAYSRISSYFGPRELWGYYDDHLGIDIPADYGTNVYASAAGTVVVSEWHSSYGYYVVIDHGNGYSTCYAHNSDLCVGVGDYVRQGEVIAKIGSTGSSSGNHCHFEVRVNGKVDDPLKYVSP